MYVHWRNAGVVQDWNAENRFEKTFVHPSMDQFIRIEMPLWNKRALPKSTKKKKGSKKEDATRLRQPTWSNILNTSTVSTVTGANTLGGRVVAREIRRNIRERGNIPMEEMPDEFETELDDF